MSLSGLNLSSFFPVSRFTAIFVGGIAVACAWCISTLCLYQLFGISENVVL